VSKKEEKLGSSSGMGASGNSSPIKLMQKHAASPTAVKVVGIKDVL
jgi:hypothetical protein